MKPYVLSLIAASVLVPTLASAGGMPPLPPGGGGTGSGGMPGSGSSTPVGACISYMTHIFPLNVSASTVEAYARQACHDGYEIAPQCTAPATYLSGSAKFIARGPFSACPGQDVYHLKNCDDWQWQCSSAHAPFPF